MSADSSTLNNISNEFSERCQMTNDSESEILDDYVLDETVKYINDASTVLKCTIMTRAKALLIYHYFRRCVHKTRYDPYMVAAACISLSLKYNEEPVEFEAVVLVLFRMIDQGSHRSTLSKELKEMGKSLTLIECIIMRMTEFSLNHIVAHEYLAYFMNDLQEELSMYNVWDVFSENCTRLASDFYLSNKCLNYKAEEIAVTVIKVSLYFLGIDVNIDGCYLKRWIKTLHDCPENKSLNIIEDVFRISGLGSSAESKKREIH